MSDSLPLIAGVLFKMMTLPFGRSRWISRYFVLLDSELRFYKDEHAESTSNIMNLHQISQVVPAPTPQHPYCFRLEPKQHTSTRPWVIECKSQKELELWISSIQSRLLKHNNPPLTPQPSPTRPLCPSVKSMVIVSPDVYRIPTLPLRCTNQQQQQEPLLTRRNKTLSPIITSTSTTTTVIPDVPTLSPVTPSPTGAILGTTTLNMLMTPSIIEQYIPTFTNKDSASPTFLSYKKRFHL